MPKYVVSTTLTDPDWTNTTVLAGDAVVQVAELKARTEGEIIIPASYQLGRTLIAHDLVDELRVVLFPVVIGEGERLFDSTTGYKPMQLIDATTIGAGLTHLRYQFLRST